MSEGWVLVTGASGFVGSRLVKKLIDRGEKVKAFVRPSSSLKQLSGYPSTRFKLAYGDITIGNTVYRALAGCDRMYHVASNFKMWDKKPERILEPAVAGTKNALEAAKQRDLERVVVTSSCATLGATRSQEEMDEESEFNLQDPETYILSKVRAEQAALEMSDEVPLVIVNPSGIVGPGDWKPTPTGGMVLKYLKWDPSIAFPTSDGGLNLVDVDDVCDGHIAAMDQGKLGERYILAGENITFGQLFSTLHELTGLAPPGKPVSSGMATLFGRIEELRARLRGREPEITYRLARDFVGAYVWASNEKARRELGFQPRSAREALARSVSWYLANGHVPESAASRVRLELSVA